VSQLRTQLSKNKYSKQQLIVLREISGLQRGEVEVLAFVGCCGACTGSGVFFGYQISKMYKKRHQNREFKY
jgi:hypothetical protein